MFGKISSINQSISQSAKFYDDIIVMPKASTDGKQNKHRELKSTQQDSITAGNDPTFQKLVISN